ncbi:MAG: ATP-binding cassette domain-containing protein [Rhodothermales bacterium]
MAEPLERALVLDAIFYEVPALRILQGAYLKVQRGQICGLFGRNGSGKTTLLKIATGQMRPSSGIVIIDGERFAKPQRQRRFEKIAYLPQTPMLPKGMLVETLIRAFPAASRHLLRDDLLAPFRRYRIDQLSGGQRRYLELKLVLSLGRSYVLLDEPFTGIEPLIIDRMTEAIREAAAQGSGILATDHYHHYMLPIADDAYLMIHKQCKHLDGRAELRAQLHAYGYLRT